MLFCFQDFFFLMKIHYLDTKTRHFLGLGVKNKKSNTWAGVFVVTGDGDSLILLAHLGCTSPTPGWLVGPETKHHCCLRQMRNRPEFGDIPTPPRKK